MIYLDNAATTKPSKSVVDSMMQVYEIQYGNASSLHQFGRQAKKLLEDSRRIFAQSIGAKAQDIIITSGGTESNNIALHALAKKRPHKKHIISSSIEHASVKNVLKDFMAQGYDITFLPVNEQGIVDMIDLQTAITEDTAFVTIMSVNNEVGSRQPIEDIATLLREKDIPFHTDYVQAYGTFKIDVMSMPVTALSVSAHKINGPKGIGFLYLNHAATYTSLLKGGGQEHDMRPGTENIPSIVGFATAVSELDSMDLQRHYTLLSQCLKEALEKQGIDGVINGQWEGISKNTKIQNIWVKQPAQKILTQLDLNGVMVSAGSACTAGSLNPSDVLLAMYPNEPQRAKESIRISFSKETTVEDIERFVEILGRFTV